VKSIIEDDKYIGPLTATRLFDLPEVRSFVFSSAASITGFPLGSSGNYEFDASSYDSLMLGEKEIIVFL